MYVQYRGLRPKATLFLHSQDVSRTHRHGHRRACVHNSISACNIRLACAVSLVSDYFFSCLVIPKSCYNWQYCYNHQYSGAMALCIRTILRFLCKGLPESIVVTSPPSHVQGTSSDVEPIKHQNSAQFHTPCFPCSWTISARRYSISALFSSEIVSTYGTIERSGGTVQVAFSLRLNSSNQSSLRLLIISAAFLRARCRYRNEYEWINGTYKTIITPYIHTLCQISQ